MGKNSSKCFQHYPGAVFDLKHAIAYRKNHAQSKGQKTFSCPENCPTSPHSPPSKKSWRVPHGQMFFWEHGFIHAIIQTKQEISLNSGDSTNNHIDTSVSARYQQWHSDTQPLILNLIREPAVGRNSVQTDQLIRRAIS